MLYPLATPLSLEEADELAGRHAFLRRPDADDPEAIMVSFQTPEALERARQDLSTLRITRWRAQK